MTSKSRFRIATADYVSAIVAPEVAVILGLEAPLMSIQFTAARGRSGYDLQAGDVDLIIGPRQILESIIYPAPALSKSLTIEVVGAEPLISVAREDNHAIGPDTPLADYLRHPHASFHLDALTHASLEQSFLIKHELEQFERILASDFLVLPMIAARTDCVAVVPASIARLAAKTVPLKTFEPPLNLPNLELAIAWQKRYINDPAHIWFRSIVKRCIMLGIST